jgi:hypothetical protein
MSSEIGADGSAKVKSAAWPPFALDADPPAHPAASTARATAAAVGAAASAGILTRDLGRMVTSQLAQLNRTRVSWISLVRRIGL